MNFNVNYECFSYGNIDLYIFVFFTSILYDVWYHISVKRSYFDLINRKQTIRSAIFLGPLITPIIVVKLIYLTAYSIATGRKLVDLLREIDGK